MRQAEAEFERGDLLQASEKGWGGAARTLEAMAVLRGLPHNAHYDLRNVAQTLVEETGNRRIGELFKVGEALHANYYEAWMREGEVSDSLDNMKELIAILEALPAPPAPVPIRRSRGRVFIRDRGDG